VLILSLRSFAVTFKYAFKRGIELKTSSLRMTWSYCNNQSSLIILVTLMHPYPYLIGANKENSMIINHSLVCTIMF
jgi:hypothetical protein